MKTSLFSPILVLLILILFAKASMLFGRVQEQTTYAMDTSTSSILINTAYAKSHSEPQASSVKKTTPKPDIEPVVTQEKKKDPIDHMTRSEMELLKELSKRRETIEKDKKDIKTRKQMVKANKKKIDKKL